VWTDYVYNCPPVMNQGLKRMTLIICVKNLVHENIYNLLMDTYI